MSYNRNLIDISDTLSAWYLANKRELPWRDISDPYLIWISEIILQQTRVNQGMSYYLRFIERFPTVADLACSEEDEVLKYWQGLGYYSRARNLHKAARQVMTDFEGVFPIEHADVLKLAGIGDYTAAAICSFAYDQPFAVVDGNVYRVLSRLFGIETPIDSGIGKKEFASLAQELISRSHPGIHNQSIMEFGALQCVPVSPDCLSCPLQPNCRAYELNSVDKLPIKSKKTKVSNRFFNYFFIELGGQTYLQKRVGKDVWQNLFEFPLVEADQLLTVEELMETDDFKKLFSRIGEVGIVKISNPMKHVLSHRVIYAQFVTVKISDENAILSERIKTPISEIDQFAVSRLMELFLEDSVY
ncbi:MAG: A/G-specific adenine glycosylase [Paludibacter sp.]|nr:A/G-specific adenine glycosylase [Paludibacter sp.]